MTLGSFWRRSLRTPSVSGLALNRWAAAMAPQGNTTKFSRTRSQPLLVSRCLAVSAATRYRCLGFGQGDANKSPGYVVDDLCAKARAFLSRKGLAEKINQATPRHERALGKGWISQLDLVGVEPWLIEFYSDSEEDLLAGMADTREPTPSEAASTDPAEGGDGDVEMSTDARSSSPATASDRLLSSEHPSDPPRASSTRSSTKMRVATLAMMLNAYRALGAEDLRSTFCLLRERDEAILHRCGCGIRFINERGENCSGCVEPSHLMFGSSEENRVHLEWHKVFNRSRVEDYPDLVLIAHKSADYCDSLF